MEANYFTIFVVFFCRTSIWISHKGTYISPSWSHLPPPSLPDPSGLFQSISFECPDSWITLAVVIYFTYGNIHISILFSQIIPPSPSPTEFKSLFFMFVSPLLPCTRGGRWEGIQDGGDRGIPMADSYWYMAKTITIL